MTDIVGLQLYTVRDETAKDFKATVRRVAEIGYAGVEFAGYGDLSATELQALLHETGLKAVGTHVGLYAIENDFEREVDYCLATGNNLLIIPWIEEKLRTGDAFKRFSESLNSYGQRLQERGITLAYHNHDFELQPAGESTLLDQLAATTDPTLVKLELDTYWVAFAGVDPIAFINRHPGRIASVHLKDMTPERTFTEVGDGTLDIAGIVQAARNSGTQRFIVENDQPAIPSLESAQRSFENLHSSLT
ncbi:sugar phosphate isomerase/epimerase family protein [Tengunoibacter tsumagoiensis]|uniref:Sugar phosphate isomerase n=1 Tax=Tengunoibacter tsumagoiensis TaxID=2014871 RepID=A0A401ZTH8_9CHLR|nr:sugar phosphate isomerase/epimerase [Tengunoibacter tsumagoiensis]GCE10171.1 sugar phosphate isomerase [Tengunoibacter tsumagoiensis]